MKMNSTVLILHLFHEMKGMLLVIMWSTLQNHFSLSKTFMSEVKKRRNKNKFVSIDVFRDIYIKKKKNLG